MERVTILVGTVFGGAVDAALIAARPLDGVLIRIKAGPSSGSLAVSRIELCLEAS